MMNDDDICDKLCPKKKTGCLISVTVIVAGSGIGDMSSSLKEAIYFLVFLPDLWIKQLRKLGSNQLYSFQKLILNWIQPVAKGFA